METPKFVNLDYLAILRGIARRHKLLIAGVFLGLAIPLVVMVSLKGRPVFVSTATIAFEASPLQQYIKDVPRGQNLGVQMVLLRSRSVGETVLDALPKGSFDELLTESQYTDYMLVLSNMVKRWLDKPPTVLSPKQRALAELQQARISFVHSSTFGVFNVNAVASNPRVAMDLVNTYIQVLLSRTRSRNQEDVRTVREFLEQQTQQAKENLTKTQDELMKFQQQKGRFSLTGQTERDMASLSPTEDALAEARSSREVLAAQIANLRQALDQVQAKEVKAAAETQATKEKEKDAGPPSPSPETLAKLNAFKAAQARLAKLEAKLAALRERFTDAHPLVRATQEAANTEQARIAQLARELPPAPPPPKESRGPRPMLTGQPERAELQRQLSALEAEDTILQGSVEQLTARANKIRTSFRSLTREEENYTQLRQNVEIQRNLLTILSDKLMSIQIGEQVEPGVIRIIDPASMPFQPSQSKNQKQILMMLLLAGGIAFGIAATIEIWRQPVETESDVQKATGLPVLGSVGVIGGPAAGRTTGRKGKASHLPIHLQASAVSARIHLQLYRAIRATVEAERLKSPFKSIMVTSPGPSEGKSTTVLNLANVFQEFGRRVLVVEADLHRPALHHTLSITSKPGLLDFLSGPATFQEICRPLASGVTLIPGQVSREDAASLLASARFKELLSLATAQFDLIFVDSPPLLVVPDDILLAAALDRVILVAKATVTSKRDLRKAQEILGQSNAQILGVVLNQAKPQDVPYYKPRYRKYYQSTETGTPSKASRRSGSSS